METGMLYRRSEAQGQGQRKMIPYTRSYPASNVAFETFSPPPLKSLSSYFKIGTNSNSIHLRSCRRDP
jgi:hypothetical protein